MLYLVGGASRSGKTWLAQKLLERRKIAYFPIDALMMGFVNGDPGFGLDPETSGVVRSEKLWPILRNIAVNLIEEKLYHPNYLLEGDELLPKYVIDLVRTYPGEIKACFLGYTHIDPAEKLQTVRQFEPDWAKFYDDDEIVKFFLAEQAIYSQYLCKECAAHGLLYFDCSDDFAATVEIACDYLIGDL